MFIKARPNEFLVAGRQGRIVNKGLAASAFRWPGTSYVKVPSAQQQTHFQMTQESSDGIPLRFKGMVIYRVARPEEACRLFDFFSGSGLESIGDMLATLCLGELRATVSGMTMQRCVEERKTTLTGVLTSILDETVSKGWGVEIEVVQVAQVYVVDAQLREQLEAEARDAIRTQSMLSGLRAQQELEAAKTRAEKENLEHSLALSTERARISAEEDRQRIVSEHEMRELQQELERKLLEKKTPVRLQEIAADLEVTEKERELAQVRSEVEEMLAHNQLSLERAQQELRKEMLPLEQMPQIAQALSGLFQGAQLNLYGEEQPLVDALTPLFRKLSESLETQH